MTEPIATSAWFECPSCRAKPGGPCRDGRTVRYSEHAKRAKLADDHNAKNR